MTPLIGAPYEAPSAERGNWLDDEIAGRVQVGGWTDAPISWPRKLKTGKAALIVTAELARAIRTESSTAIQEHWGVSLGTVHTWRKALGVGRVTDGTRQLLQERTGVPPEAAARGRAVIAATPEIAERVAAGKRGKPAHPNTVAALAKAIRQPRPAEWGRRANAWMLAGKAKDDPPPGWRSALGSPPREAEE